MAVSVVPRQVVENPRFGLFHTLRVLSLHVVILYLCFVLASLSWVEFLDWGNGPIGRVLLFSRSRYRVGLSYGEAGGEGGEFAEMGTGLTGARETAEFGQIWKPEQEGTAFALVLLFELLVTAVDVLLSSLKYLANIVEMYKGESGKVRWPSL